MAQTIHAVSNLQVGTTQLVSPQTTVPAGVTDIEAQLVLATSQPNWDNASVAGATWEWRIERLNGAVWELLVGEDVANGNPLAVGFRPRGRLPRMGVSRGDLPGMVVRAMARCSAPVFVSIDVILGP